MSHLGNQSTATHLGSVSAARAQQDPAAVAQSIVVKAGGPAVLPHVVFKVLELSGSADSAALEMERAITVDPGFSAKILAHANSSFYGLSRKVTSVRDAIVYLGFKAVREMAMTVGVFNMFVGKNDHNSLRRRDWWRRSVDTAVCARFVAEVTGKMDPADAYTCGLLHFIGKSLLDRVESPSYEAVEQRMAVGTSDSDAEFRVFGCDHQDVAEAAGRIWGLPDQLVGSFRYKAPSAASVAAACVAMADAIASAAVEGNGVAKHLPDWAVAMLELSPESADDLFDKGLERIALAAQMQF